MEAFPTIEEDPANNVSTTDPSKTPITPTRREEAHSDVSTISGRIRSASKRFNESAPPVGFMAATGEIASSILSMNSEGRSLEGQVIEKERRKSPAQPESVQSSSPEATPNRASVAPQGGIRLQDHIFENRAIHSNHEVFEKKGGHNDGGEEGSYSQDAAAPGPNFVTLIEPYPNGYQFPPNHTWQESSRIFLKASWTFVTQPLGFVITLYGLNVVAWGGMLFLLLCNASPAMCHPRCDDIDSPRRIWIEIDSQILNALFCVTGFGLIPWRFRDFYHLLNYRINKTPEGLTRLAGIHRAWFRLDGSEKIPIEIGPSNIEENMADVPLSSVPYPPTSIPDAPLTGIRASPTPLWKLDFVIWAFVINTALQAVLSGFMWGFDRQRRPSWSTGLFVALACIVAAAGGVMIFLEGKRVKSIEGVPVSEEDQERLRRDQEQGIFHFNNINDAAPKKKKVKT